MARHNGDVIKRHARPAQPGEIHEQILVGKVLDFLQLQANVEEVPASAPAA